MRNEIAAVLLVVGLSTASPFAHQSHKREVPQEHSHNHFLDLVRILHLCLKFEFTPQDIHNIREGFAKWVLRYEEYVRLIPSNLKLIF